MAIHNYALTPGRIEKFKGDIIKYTQTREILAKVGRQVEMPKNNSKTYVARTFIPYGAIATKAGRNQRWTYDNTQGPAGTDRSVDLVDKHRSVDGVTSSADTIVPIDYTTQIFAYECLFSFTRETQDFYEDDIPATMKEMVGDRVSLVNEQIVYGALKGCTTVFYGGGGSSIGTVAGPINLNLLRKVAKQLMLNDAKPMATMLGAGPKINTAPAGDAFFVYIHTDLVSDLRQLVQNAGPVNVTGFIPVENYASPQSAVPGEVGKIEGFRFIAAPIWPPLLSAGAAIGSTGCVSSLGTNIYVYPIIVMGQNAFSQIALRGMSVMEPTFIPASEKTKSDPHGKRGYAGAYWYKGTLIENDGWMAVGYVGNLTIGN